MKDLIILILLSPFLIWQANIDKCDLWVDGVLWECSAPYEHDLQYLSEGTHCVEIESVFFFLNKKSRENKKFIFNIYDITHNPEDAECFDTSNLPYKEKVKK